MNVVSILALNLVFLLAGVALLGGVRGFRSIADCVRLLGVAYMLGLGAVVVCSSILLVFGVPFGIVTVALVVVSLSAVGAALPVVTRRRVPEAEGHAVEPVRGIGIAAAVVALAYLAALVNLAPRLGMWEPDAWTFWTPKAQAIWHFGALYEPTFTTLPGPTYPLFVPVLEAIDFHAMGEVDVLALHLQFALLLAGFVAALAGLLRPAVSRAWFWPVIALVLVTPELNYRGLSPLADFPLDYFFALAAVCLVLWIERRQTWLLVVGAGYLAVAMSIKREGLLLAGALVVGALVASWGARRWAYPRLLAAAGAAALTMIPWRVWWMTHDLTGEAPATTPSDWAGSLSRVWPSFELLIGRLLDWGLWLVLFPAALVAAAFVLVLLPGRRSAATLFVTTVALVLASFTWVFVAVPDLPTSPRGEQPAPRAMASLAFLSAALLPLMLARLGDAPNRRSRPE